MAAGCPIAINVILFTLFALHHSLLARTRAKAGDTAHDAGAGTIVYVWTAVFSF